MSSRSAEKEHLFCITMSLSNKFLRNNPDHNLARYQRIINLSCSNKCSFLLGILRTYSLWKFYITVIGNAFNIFVVVYYLLFFLILNYITNIFLLVFPSHSGQWCHGPQNGTPKKEPFLISTPPLLLKLRFGMIHSFK